MTWWLCQTHRKAGVAHDQPCCQTTRAIASETDARVWYQLRMRMKPAAVWDEIVQLRCDPYRMREALVRHARRQGRTFVIG